MANELGLLSDQSSYLCRLYEVLQATCLIIVWLHLIMNKAASDVCVSYTCQWYV
jgi:hypothetical protein